MLFLGFAVNAKIVARFCYKFAREKDKDHFQELQLHVGCIRTLKRSSNPRLVSFWIGGGIKWWWCNWLARVSFFFFNKEKWVFFFTNQSITVVRKNIQCFSWSNQIRICNNKPRKGCSRACFRSGTLGKRWHSKC